MKTIYSIKVEKTDSLGEFIVIGIISEFNRLDIASKVFNDLCEELTTSKIWDYRDKEPSISSPVRRYSLNVKNGVLGCSKDYELDYFII